MARLLTKKMILIVAAVALIAALRVSTVLASGEDAPSNVNPDSPNWCPAGHDGKPGGTSVSTLGY